MSRPESETALHTRTEFTGTARGLACSLVGGTAFFGGVIGSLYELINDSPGLGLASAAIAAAGGLLDLVGSGIDENALARFNAERSDAKLESTSTQTL